MSIIQITPFDLITSSSLKLMASTGFWSSLTRITRHSTGTARLLLVTDKLKLQDIKDGFSQVAVPREQLDMTMKWYYLQYESFLSKRVQTTRHMRVYLIMDSPIGDLGLVRLLGSYGIQASLLGQEAIPVPFTGGRTTWNRLIDYEENTWAIIRSRRQQSGMLHPKMLHRLFALDFPVWCSIEIGTYSNEETTRMLRLKDAAARYEKSSTTEARGDAQNVKQTISRIRNEINRTGCALHEVRFSILVGAENESTLSQRLEVVRGSTGMDMEGWESRASEYITDMFASSPPRRVEGSLIPSHGLSILTSSAMSYRRRTKTRGVYFGTDRNQAPVIIDIFDPHHPSYNMVVLGQTGSGKVRRMAA